MIVFALFGYGDDTVDNFNGCVCVFLVNSGNIYRSIIVNINFGIGFFNDFTDNFSAGADDFTNLVYRNLIEIIRGARGEISSRGAGNALAISPKM